MPTDQTLSLATHAGPAGSAAAAACRADLLMIAATTAQSMLAGRDVTAVVTSAMALLGQTTTASRVVLLQHQGAGVTRPRFGRCVREWCDAVTPRHLALPELERIDYGAGGLRPTVERLLAHRRLMCTNGQLPAPVRPLGDASDAGTFLAVPVAADDDRWGVLCLTYARPDAVHPHDVEAIESVAASLGAGLARRDDDQRQQQVQRVVELLGRVATLANSEPADDGAIDQILEEIAHATGRHTAHLVAVSGAGARPIAGTAPDEPSRRWLRQVEGDLAAGTPPGFVTRVVDQGCPTFHVGDLGCGEPAAFASALAVPVTIQGRVVAVLVSYATDPQPPGRDLVDALTSVCDIVARLFERQHHLRALERSNGELERFAYVASHDLQEPLRKVTTYCDLIAEQYDHALDDEGRVFLGYAVDGAHRMRKLIQDLLAYARLAGDDAPVAPVDLSEVVADVLAWLGPAIADAGATVSVAALPVVNGHRDQLARLVQNLIDNAIKYRSDRPLTIEVQATVRAGVTHITVTDNGIGVEPQHAERIFEVFRRLHSREAYPGTGVGLAICRRIAQQHGGEIWFEPTERGGSTFHLDLPVGPSVASRPPISTTDRIHP